MIGPFILRTQFKLIDLTNRCIPFELIEDHWKEYQLFLEKIADYLVDASFWCENEFGVEFFDVSPIKD